MKKIFTKSVCMALLFVLCIVGLNAQERQSLNGSTKQKGDFIAKEVAIQGVTQQPTFGFEPVSPVKGKTRSEVTLLPGAFGPGGCETIPDGLKVYSSDYQLVTGSNGYGDLKYGYLYKGTSGSVTSVKAWLARAYDGGTPVNIYAEVWAIGANDLPTTLLGTSNPISTSTVTLSTSVWIIEEHTFTFATPVAVPVNFAVAITVPAYSDDQDIAIATSTLDCYLPGTEHYPISWSDEGDGYEWMPMNYAWGTEPDGLFDLAILPVVETGTIGGDCNAPTALIVNYDQNCNTATLTWTAPTGKGKSTQTIENPLRDIDKKSISKEDLKQAIMQYAVATKPETAMPNSKGTLLFEGFENAPLYGVPTGWTRVQLSGADSEWEVWDDYDWDPHEGSGYQFAACVYPDDDDSNAWLFSTGMSLTSGTTYEISFWAIVYGYAQWDEFDHLEVKIGTSQSAGSMLASPLYYNTTQIIEDWTKITVTFTPTTTGTYYLGFHNFTPDGEGLFTAVDDVLVTDDDAPPTGDFTYNIYRDGTIINSAPVTTESYTDNTFLATAGHTWEVKAICEGGDESDPATKTMGACDTGEPGDCNPPQNLAVTTKANCDAVLTWEPPVGKKSTVVVDEMMLRRAEEMKAKGLVQERGERQAFTTPAMKAPKNNNVISSENNSFLIPGKGPNTVAYGIDCYPGNNNAITLPLNNPGSGTYIGGSLPYLPTGGDWVNGEWFVFNAGDGQAGILDQNIYKVNPANGSYTVAATHTIPDGVLGMAYNDADGFAYASTDLALYKVDLSTGATTLACNTPTFLYCFAITCDGRFIGMTSDGNAGTTQIIEVNPATGAATTLASVPFWAWYVQDMAVDREDGMIYWAACDVDPYWGSVNGAYLMKFDTGNNQLTNLGSLPGGAEVVGFAIPGACNPNLAKAPTNVTLTPTGTSLNGTFAWTNPSTTLGGDPITITNIVVERDGAFYQNYTTNLNTGANCTIPVSVTEVGNHSFSVYAVTSEGNGGKGSATGVFGDVCMTQVIVLQSGYGDEWNWTLTDDETGAMLAGGGTYATGSYVSTGTFDVMLTGNATFYLWSYGISYGDNTAEVKIMVNGEEVYYTGVIYITSEGITRTEYIECEGTVTFYKVYRDGTPIATTKALTYTDTDWDHTGATWSVTAICEEGGESNAASASEGECEAFCPPVENFAVAYNAGCGADLTWDAPTGKKGNSKDCDDVALSFGSTLSGSGPVHYLWEYGYTQVIYDEAEVGATGTITKIAYNWAQSASYSYPITIFMGHTTKSSFASYDASEFITHSTLQQVYSGTVNFNNANTWFEIELQTPFEYTGGNLVVAVLNDKGAWFSGSGSTAWQVGSSAPDYKYIYAYDMSNPVTPNNVATALGRNYLQTRPNTQFTVCGGGSGGGAYTILRDGDEIAQVSETYYSDYGFDYMVEHTWSVKTVCDENLESEVSQTLEACEAEGNCNPAQNLEGEYTQMCDIVLTWEPPVGKKSSITPIAPSAERGNNVQIITIPSGIEMPEAEKLEMREMAAPKNILPTDQFRPASMINNSMEIPEIPLLGGSRGNTAYAYKAYPSPQGYISFDVDNILGHSVVAAQSTWGAGDYYDGVLYVWGNADNTGTFYKVDAATGTVTQTITGAADVSCTEMAYDYSTNTMYGYVSGAIYTVNLSTGARTQVATTSYSGNMFGFAINAQGQAYGVGTDGNFYQIDKATGQCTIVGPTGQTDIGYIQCMNFDHNTGILYWAHSGQVNDYFRTINVATGQATLVVNAYEMTAFHVPYVAGDPCPAVSNVQASVVSGTQDVNITWVAATGSPTSTQVTRDGGVVATLAGTATSYSDENVTPGNHTYCVKAIYPAGDDCIPQNVCAAPVMVTEILEGGCEAVIIGNGNEDQYYYPIVTLYNYSYTQQIFDASELGIEEGNLITAISFNYVFATEKSFPVEIYLGNTSQSTFASTSNFIPITELTSVFDDNVTMNNSQDWYTFYIDPFIYTGENLVIAVVNKGHTWFSGYPFLVHNTTGNKGVRYYQDAGLISLNTPTSATNSGVGNTRNNVRFVVCEGAYSVKYNVYRDGELVTTTKETTYTDSGFDPLDLHHWKVTVICEEEGESAGIYLTKEACAGCYGPGNLEVEYADDCEGAYLTWEDPTGKKSNNGTTIEKPVEYTFIPREGGMNTGNTLSINNEKPVTLPTQFGGNNSKSEILWDNTNINIGTGGLVSAYWSGNDNWVWTADDFDAETPWIIEKVISQGFSNSPSLLPTKMDVAIFTDAAGHPGTEIYRNKAIPVSDGTNPEIILPTPFQLPAPGKYWIAIAGAYDATVTTNTEATNYRWNIYHGTTPKGSVFQLYDKLGMFGAGAATWLDASSLVAGSYSMYFRIEGLIGGELCDPVTNLNANVQGKKVILTWTAPTGNPTGYEIFRDDESIATVTTTSYTDNTASDGVHTYGVKALFTGDCYPQIVKTSPVIVGSMCMVEVVVSYVLYGDEINWAIKDENGAILAGAGPQVNGGTISAGTFSTLFAGGASFRFWNGGGYGWGDNEITIAVYYDGEQIYSLNNMQGVPVGYNSGEIPFECFDTKLFFNIYRDGELMEEGINALDYFDTGFDHSKSHTWCVAAICDDGSESIPACIDVAKCSCDPVENLTGYYNEDCNVVLTWDGATGKSAIYTPEDIVVDPKVEAANLARIQAEDQAKMAMDNNTLSVATARTNPNPIHIESQDYVRGPGSDVYHTVDGFVYKGTIANPFGPSIGNAGYVQCLDYINGTIYGVRWSNGNQFGTVNPTTGAFTVIKANFHTTGADGASICYNPVNGLTYVFPWTGSDSEASRFGTVDLATGDFTTIATWGYDGTKTYFAAIDMDGVCYAVQNLTNEFGTIDLATGNFTVKANLSGFSQANYIQDLAFDRETGELYWIAQTDGGNYYYKIDKVTGALTNLGANTTNSMGFCTITESNPNLVKAPTNFTGEQVDNTFDVNLSWTNPSQTAGGTPLTSISQIVLKRNNVTINTFNNPAVGGDMTFTDNVPENGTYSYAVYAVVGGEDGASASTSVKVKVKQILCAGDDVDVITGNSSIGGSTGTGGGPVYFYYKNSYVQQIFTAEEIGITGTKITSVAYQYTYGTAFDLPVQVYMANTTKSSFLGSSSAEFIPLDQLQLVFEGEVNFTSSEAWTTIDFDQAFSWEGENVVVAVVCNRGSSWDWFGDVCFTGGAMSNKVILNYSDTYALDPANPGSNSTTIALPTNRSNIRFNICPLTYNIYEDGVLIEENYLGGNNYIYNALDMTPWNTHTYEVSVICINGKESPKAAITIEPCEYLERVEGYIFNCVTGDPIEGATATVSYLDLQTQTNAIGYYSHPYVNCNKDQTVTGSMSGYYTNTTEPFFVACGGETMAPDLCLQPIPEWLVFGDVRGCDNSYIVGGKVVLASAPGNEHHYEFETTTGEFGQFEFPEVYMCQPGESYILTVTKPGWEVSETVVVVFGNTNAGRVILYDIIKEPTKVEAVEASDYQTAIVTWTPAPFPAEGGIGALGYKLWRLLPDQKDDETLWSILTNDPVDDVVFIDNAWANYAPGKYMYAVKTAYCGDKVSEPVFSDTIVKNIQVGFEIKVTTECENNPLGAVVSLTNTNYQYELISTNTGAFFPKVWLGTYTLKITLDGYTTYTDTAVMVTAAGSYDALLKIAKKDPTGLKVDTLGNTAHLTWSFDAVAPIAGFTIYLDNEVVKTGVTATEYYFANLENGDYKAEVEANYCATVNSAKKAIEFTIFVSTGPDDPGVKDYEFDYTLYPNPATEMITIQRSNACEATIELYNAMGKHISTYETTEHLFEINVGSLAVGTYFIRINEGDISVVKSFVKK